MKNNNLYNPTFRQKVTDLDKSSLAELVGTLGGNVKVKVVKNTKKTYYTIIPMDPDVGLNVLGNIQAAGGYGVLASLTASTLAGGPR